MCGGVGAGWCEVQPSVSPRRVRTKAPARGPAACEWRAPGGGLTCGARAPGGPSVLRCFPVLSCSRLDLGRKHTTPFCSSVHCTTTRYFCTVKPWYWSWAVGAEEKDGVAKNLWPARLLGVRSVDKLRRCLARQTSWGQAHAYAVIATGRCTKMFSQLV